MMDSVIDSNLTKRFPNSSLSPTSFLTQRNFSRSSLLFVLLAAVLVLTACGPARNGVDEGQLQDEVARIAQEFQADQDVAKARAALDALDVANPRQWLTLQTEQMISSNTDPALTAGLVKLAEALDLQSAMIRTYAEQQGLAEPTPTFVLEAVGVDAAPPAETPAAPREPVATDVAQAPPVSPATDITTTAPVTEPSPALLAALPTPTEVSAPAAPQGKATGLINVRSGPGTDFSAVASLDTEETVELTGKTPAGDWWQVRAADGTTGWVFGQLLETSGDVTAVAVAADIPTPPPAPTPAPVAEQPVATEAPAEAATDAATPAPVADGPDFRLVETRLWDVFENGGSKDGPSVTCGFSRELHVHVRDANGSPLNGVAVQALLGAQETIVTGSQGKGDGKSEFVLGGGQYVKISRDADGREVTSDTAYGLTTDPREIPIEALIAGQYCSDAAQCDVWLNAGPPPCISHYSWTVTFQRKY